MKTAIFCRGASRATLVVCLIILILSGCQTSRGTGALAGGGVGALIGGAAGGWQGAAMLEYRIRDRDGSFDFIELNPRYWQYLHLDLLAGIDFPRLQIGWFEGQKMVPPPPPREIVCGDLWPGEISRLLEIWRSARFGLWQSLRETLAFLLRLLDPRIASDYVFPGDRTLYWHRVAQFMRGCFRRRN